MHFVCDRENWDKAVTIHKGSEISYYSSTQCDPVEASCKAFSYSAYFYFIPKRLCTDHRHLQQMEAGNSLLKYAATAAK